MIFLSKGGEDPYINTFARGCGYPVIDTDDFVYEQSTDPLVLRGILKKKWMKQCLKDGRTFYYVDTGYFGNEKSRSNPNGWKLWHRIVKNDLQHGSIVTRPDDRFKMFNKKFVSWKKQGRKILIAKPDEKPMRYYDLDLEQWTNDTIETIKKNTDRPIIVRERAPKRIDRISGNTLQEALDDDIFALVTFNSVAAVESIFHGIPVFSLSPSNAANPVSSNNLRQIETPYYPDHDLLYSWGCHLAYGQFHTNELKSGKALRYLKEWW
jgi:hypothetical protein